MNKTVVVNSWTSDTVREGQFEVVVKPMGEPEEGQFLVRVLLLSMDPSQRSYVHEEASFWPRVEPGEKMKGRGIAQVVKSRAAGVSEGEIVMCACGWSEYAVITPAEIEFRVNPDIADPDCYMSVLGATGVTAWCGVSEVLDVRAGDTVLISTAAGAVGSVAVRLAKLRGAKVIGVTGHDSKVRFLKDDLGADVAINYKTTEDLTAAIQEAAPSGVNGFFDMVGGEQLRAGFKNMAPGGTIGVCGTISQPNTSEELPGVMHERQILVRRLKIRGFLYSDFKSQTDQARKELAHWLNAGEIENKLDVLNGLENSGKALVRVLSGENTGKQAVRVAVLK